MIRSLHDSVPDEFLGYIYQDPVHDIRSGRSLDRRCRRDRDIFFMCEGADPAAVLCVAYTQGLPNNIQEILNDEMPVINREQATHAVFYSVFRTTVGTESRNLGADLVLEAAQLLREKNPNITNFVTMSPIPNLRKYFADIPVIDSIVHFLEEMLDPVARFHINNGAQVMRVIAGADDSDRRQDQSWGFMVNYDYTETLSKS